MHTCFLDQFISRAYGPELSKQNCIYYIMEKIFVIAAFCVLFITLLDCLLGAGRGRNFSIVLVSKVSWFRLGKIPGRVNVFSKKKIMAVVLCF